MTEGGKSSQIEGIVYLKKPEDKIQNAVCLCLRRREGDLI